LFDAVIFELAFPQIQPANEYQNTQKHHLKGSDESFGKNLPFFP
jgi:hypothetical protein